MKLTDVNTFPAELEIAGVVPLAKKKEEEKEIDIIKHVLVPQHAILEEKERTALTAKYNILPQQLPKIFHNDPAVKAIGAKPGDVLKVERISRTAGTAEYFRLVIKEE